MVLVALAILVLRPLGPPHRPPEAAPQWLLFAHLDGDGDAHDDPPNPILRFKPTQPPAAEDQRRHASASPPARALPSHATRNERPRASRPGCLQHQAQTQARARPGRGNARPSGGPTRSGGSHACSIRGEGVCARQASACMQTCSKQARMAS